MTAYITRRLLSFIPSLLAISILVFFMIHLVPGDPAQTMLGVDATPEAVRNLREMLGLDRPLGEQFVQFFGRLLLGDLGRSYYLERPVSQAIVERMPVTVSLAGLGLLVALGMGVPAGIAAAVRQNSWLDGLVMAGALLGLSVPSFWLGLNLISVFSVALGWFPTGGYTPIAEAPLDWLRSLVLPAVALGLAQAALIARMTRSSMLEVLRMDYIRTARAKGLLERVVIYRHAFRNSLIPVVTVVGIVVGLLLGGSVIIETVFTLPGMGRLIVSAVQHRDYPVVQGVILFIASSYLLTNLAVDLAYAWIDPKIRYS